MLFELLTGRLPFARGTVKETFERHLNYEPESLQRHIPVAPVALATLVSSLLARDPADRPRIGSVIQQLGALEIGTARQRRAA